MEGDQHLTAFRRIKRALRGISNNYHVSRTTVGAMNTCPLHIMFAVSSQTRFIHDKRADSTDRSTTNALPFTTLPSRAHALPNHQATNLAVGVTRCSSAVNHLALVPYVVESCDCYLVYLLKPASLIRENRRLVKVGDFILG